MPLSINAGGTTDELHSFINISEPNLSLTPISSVLVRSICETSKLLLRAIDFHDARLIITMKSDFLFIAISINSCDFIKVVSSIAHNSSHNNAFFYYKN